MLKKLRLRLVVINMSIVTVILLSIFGLLYHFVSQNLEQQSLSMLYSVAASPDFTVHPGDERHEVHLPFFSLRQINGQWVADKGNFYDLSDEEELQDLVQAVEKAKKDYGVLEAYHLRFYRMEAPTGQQIAFADITSEQDTLLTLTEICGVIGALSFCVFLGISLILARWAVKPVDTAWKQQKQFVADASHELKTPLTVIQTSTELLMQTEEQAERVRFGSSILEMSHRMKLLVEDLLILARADNGQTLNNVTSVDLSRIVSDALLPFEPIFFEAGLRLTSRISEGIICYGDGGKLRQLIDILLDNARKYSADGGETTLSLQKNSKNVILQVVNPSEPLSVQQCRDIFKRFYRVDSARTGGESFGLGLSIAESIVVQHGGKIAADYREGFFSITVELPVQMQSGRFPKKRSH